LIERSGGGGGGSSLLLGAVEDGTGLTGAKMTGVGGIAAVDPLLTKSLRDGGVPLRERLRDVMRVLGVCSKEPLREPFEEIDASSSSSRC
jgi:hypothetical protein